MWEFLYYLVLMCLLAGGLIVGGLVLHGFVTTGTMPSMSSFMGGARPEPRIDVIEQANVDGKRRLLLIRRDEVEHLIMTGGPVDVVIETGIGQPRRAPVPEIAETPVFSRQARRFGQAVAEPQ